MAAAQCLRPRERTWPCWECPRQLSKLCLGCRGLPSLTWYCVVWFTRSISDPPSRRPGACRSSRPGPGQSCWSRPLSSALVSHVTGRTRKPCAKSPQIADANRTKRVPSSSSSVQQTGASSHAKEEKRRSLCRCPSPSFLSLASQMTEIPPRQRHFHFPAPVADR